MPNFNELLEEIKAEGVRPTAIDTVRRKYLKQVHAETQRNVIAYYSGWLQRPNNMDAIINDKDKSGLMLAIHKLEKDKGLDLILHTPGGDLAATESVVDYLYKWFNYDIRVIVPQISMSAGTMIALASREIVMGKHSNLGPIDPQIGGVACQAVLDEFKKATDDIKDNPHSAPLWIQIISKYHPTFLGTCQHAVHWSEEIAKKWLSTNMCKDCPEKIPGIMGVFASHSNSKSHSRHISAETCKEAGLKITNLEDNPTLQEAVLTTHHAYMHTFGHTRAVKIIENHIESAYIESIPE